MQTHREHPDDCSHNEITQSVVESYPMRFVNTLNFHISINENWKTSLAR